MNELVQTQDRYLSQCNGDWEHQCGLKIRTLDNPGWSIEIDLAETELETRSFDAVEKGEGLNLLTMILTGIHVKSKTRNSFVIIAVR